MKPNQIIQSSLDSGKLFLYGELNSKTAKIFSQKLRYLCCDKKLKEIRIYINCEGGDWESGCGIVDDILGFQQLGINICTIAVGCAESFGAYILAAGSERYATEHSIIMLHPIQVSHDDTELRTIKQDMDFTHKHHQKFIEMIAKKCGNKSKIKIEEFVKKVEQTWYMTASEAKKNGIIDNIWDYNWEVKT